MKRAFTLLELSFVLAIIAGAVALVTPVYETMLLRSRAAEAPEMLQALAHAERGYFRDHGRYLACGPTAPAPAPTPRARCSARSARLCSGGLPMRRQERGAVLAAVLFLIAVCSVAAGVVWLRLSVDESVQRSRDARMELFWLARSAVVHPPAKTLTVALPEVGPTEVRVVRGKDQTVTAEASSPRFGTARVEARRDGPKVVAWRESFSRGARAMADKDIRR